MFAEPARGVRPFKTWTALATGISEGTTISRYEWFEVPCCGKHGESVIPSDARKISKKPRQYFSRGEIPPLPGAADNLDENVGIFVGQAPTIHRLCI